MAKRKIVEFKRADAPAPGRSDEEPGRPFLLKLPVTLTLPAVASRKVRLGISCNLPTVVTRVGSAPELFAPGQELEVIVKNNDTVNPLILGQGEVVARCFVMDSTELEVVDG